MPKRGRPLALTREKLKQAEQELEKSPVYEIVAALIGITPRTWSNYMRRGELLAQKKERRTDLKLTENDALLRDFFLAASKKRMRAAQDGLAYIRKAAADDPRNWTAMARFLQFCFPDLFGDWREQIKELTKALKAVQSGSDGTALPGRSGETKASTKKTR